MVFKSHFKAEPTEKSLSVDRNSFTSPSIGGFMRVANDLLVADKEPSGMLFALGIRHFMELDRKGQGKDSWHCYKANDEEEFRKPVWLEQTAPASPLL